MIRHLDQGALSYFTLSFWSLNMYYLYRILILSLCVLNIIQLNAQTFSVTPNTMIEGPITIFAELNVSGLNVLMDENFGLESICLDISHTYDGDLTLSLISPSGTEILLSQKNGGSGDNYTNTCFDGNLVNPSITNASPPFTGNFIPEESLGNFNSGIESADGIWKLKIYDDFSADDGVFNSFSLTFSNSPAIVPKAENDECESAIELAINANYTCNLTFPGTISGASASNYIDNCMFLPASFDDDVWFKFQATRPRHSIEVLNIIGSTKDLVFQTYSGLCGELNFLTCFDSETFIMDNLDIGNIYFIRLASKAENENHNSTFTICIKEGIPDPPSNDECNGAIEIMSCINGTIQGTVAGATPSSNNLSCNNAGSFSNDVWFKFTPSQSSLDILITNINGTAEDLDLQLNKGNGGNPCNNLSQVDCYFDPQQGDLILYALTNLDAGSTYFLRIASFNDAPQNTSFELCMDIPPSPPSNDECAGAIELPRVPNSCNFVHGNVYGSTQSSQINDCIFITDVEFNDDIWFYFIATNASDTIDILNISGSSIDLMFQVLEGSCNSTNSFFCHDDPNNVFILDNLNIGETYYLRIASYSSFTENISFDVRIRSCNQFVCSNSSSGFLSLPYMVNCSPPDAEIKFASDLSGNVIELEDPLIISKNVTFNGSDLTKPLVIGNMDINRTGPLIEISKILNTQNILISGKTKSSMKLLLKNGGIWHAQ